MSATLGYKSYLWINSQITTHVPPLWVRTSFKEQKSNFWRDKDYRITQISRRYQFSCSFVSNSLLPHGLQHARPPCQSPTPKVYSNSCPLSYWYHLTFNPLSYHSPPVFSLSQNQGLFEWISSLHQVAKVLEFQLQHQSVLPMNI